MLPADVREFASDRFISRFLKAREEDAPYGLDIFEVMRVYIPSVMKSIHDVPAVERARKMVEEIPLEKKGDQVIADYFQNLRSYANSYLDNYLGKTDIQRSEIAQAEVKLARAVASYYYRLLLGWNPFSAAIDLTQTGLNTFPVLGTRYTLEGIRRLSTPNGRKEVRKVVYFWIIPYSPRKLLKQRERCAIYSGRCECSTQPNFGIVVWRTWARRPKDVTWA